MGGATHHGSRGGVQLHCLWICSSHPSDSTGSPQRACQVGNEFHGLMASLIYLRMTHTRIHLNFSKLPVEVMDISIA